MWQQQEIHSTKVAIERDSDALSLDKLGLELQEHPPVEAPGKIQDIRDRLEESDRTMTQLVQAEVTARQAFEAIDGSEKAAVAEARRQEAIADMSTAGEEYLQLATASTLPKWAVDRYRDRKQLVPRGGFFKPRFTNQSDGFERIPQEAEFL